MSKTIRPQKTVKGSTFLIVSIMIALVTPLAVLKGTVLQGETITVLASVLPTTTPTPTPKEDREPEKARVAGENEEIKELIFKTFGKEEGAIAYAIAKAESKLNHNAENCNGDVECSIGLFQINLAKNAGQGPKVHWDKVPGETLKEKKEWLKVPENNILIAKFIRGSSGFYPWSVYKNKSYKKFL